MTGVSDKFSFLIQNSVSLSIESCELIMIALSYSSTFRGNHEHRFR